MAEPAAARTLVLLRHGRTAWNREGRAQGHLDVELDELGHAQARAAAAALAGRGATALWTSDLSRARQTAAYVEAATGLVAVADARLREYDLGARSGLTRAEFAERFPEEHAAWIAGALAPGMAGEETTEQVRARVGAALAECLASLAAGETGIVVLHGACLKVGLYALLEWPWASSRTLRVLDNCGWAVVVDDHRFVRPGTLHQAQDRHQRLRRRQAAHVDVHAVGVGPLACAAGRGRACAGCRRTDAHARASSRSSRWASVDATSRRWFDGVTVVRAGLTWRATSLPSAARQVSSTGLPSSASVPSSSSGRESVPVSATRSAPTSLPALA